MREYCKISPRQQMGGENLLCSQRQNIWAQRQVLFIARDDNFFYFFFFLTNHLPSGKCYLLVMISFTETGKIVKQFNIEMDASFRVSCLLYTLPFLLFWCLHFIPTMYMIEMIIYYILEYFDVWSSFFTFQLYFYSRSLASHSLLFGGFLLKITLIYDSISHLPVPSSMTLLLHLALNHALSDIPNFKSCCHVWQSLRKGPGV